jgi:hypothetical protein
VGTPDQRSISAAATNVDGVAGMDANTHAEVGSVNSALKFNCR